MVPFVFREHASLCVVIVTLQLPPLHVGVDTVRVRVPIRSQASSNPPQLLQAPDEGVPQPAPFVERVQARDSMATDAPQDPLLQAKLVTARV